MKCQIFNIFIIILISDGNSEIGAICLIFQIIKIEISNKSVVFLQIWAFFLHKRATSTELPSYIITIICMYVSYLGPLNKKTARILQGKLSQDRGVQTLSLAPPPKTEPVSLFFCSISLFYVPVYVFFLISLHYSIFPPFCIFFWGGDRNSEFDPAKLSWALEVFYQYPY